MKENIIEIRDISKRYKGADDFSVEKLNLSIYKNEIFGLLGPNGAGKTTLISMLCGLLKPSSGSFTIDGLSFKNDGKRIRQTIGVVPQEYALYPTLTAYENLLYFGSMFNINASTLKNNISESLEYLGLTKYANKKIDTYSGGMKRRVNLIAGILHNPKVLFLDEPTVGVDVQSKNVIINHLKKLNDSGTTIIYTSHHLTEAQQFCDRVGILDKGTIITKGTPSQLINNVADAHNLEDVFISLTGSELRDHA